MTCGRCTPTTQSMAMVLSLRDLTGTPTAHRFSKQNFKTSRKSFMHSGASWMLRRCCKSCPWGIVFALFLRADQSRWILVKAPMFAQEPFLWTFLPLKQPWTPREHHDDKLFSSAVFISLLARRYFPSCCKRSGLCSENRRKRTTHVVKRHYTVCGCGRGAQFTLLLRCASKPARSVTWNKWKGISCSGQIGIAWKSWAWTRLDWIPDYQGVYLVVNQVGLPQLRLLRHGAKLTARQFVTERRRHTSDKIHWHDDADDCWEFCRDRHHCAKVNYMKMSDKSLIRLMLQVNKFYVQNFYWLFVFYTEWIWHIIC